MITTRNVHIDTALHTPQFWLLWTTLCCNVTAGIGVIGVAKTMVDDIFCTTMPLAASAPFAALYVQMISVFNMAGRFGWASASDKLGRKNTYHTFFGLGIPLYVLWWHLCCFSLGAMGVVDGWYNIHAMRLWWMLLIAWWGVRYQGT